MPMIPDYAGANLSGVMPGCLLAKAGQRPSWFPEPLQQAERIVLLLIDGLGFLQLEKYGEFAPNLRSMIGSGITTVAPSTTASALTSLTTGASPSEHGIVGYRMDMGKTVMNSLRWWSDERDLRNIYQPSQIQPIPPFAGFSIPVLSRSELEGSAFTESHLRGGRAFGWRVASSIVAQAASLVQAGESFVYAYYDGIDKIAHEKGFGTFYEAELSAVDWLIGALLQELPVGTTLAVVADHGQVQVGENIIYLSPEVLACVRQQSGEGRFRWLHAVRGAQDDLVAILHEQFDEVAWVASLEQVIEEAWLGPARGATMSQVVQRRLGDVALAPFEPVTFFDPQDSGPFPLVCRHGSLTPQEMLIPLLARTV